MGWNTCYGDGGDGYMPTWGDFTDEERAAEEAKFMTTREEFQDAMEGPWSSGPAYVYQCSNPSCGQLWRDDPNGHCPACKQTDGRGWSCVTVLPRSLPSPQGEKP